MISFLKVRIRFPEGTGISLLSMGIIFSLCTTCYSHLLRFYDAIADSLSYPPIIFLLKLAPRNTLPGSEEYHHFPRQSILRARIILESYSSSFYHITLSFMHFQLSLSPGIVHFMHDAYEIKEPLFTPDPLHILLQGAFPLHPFYRIPSSKKRE